MQRRDMAGIRAALRILIIQYYEKQGRAQNDNDEQPEHFCCRTHLSLSSRWVIIKTFGPVCRICYFAAAMSSCAAFTRSGPIFFVQSSRIFCVAL